MRLIPGDSGPVLPCCIAPKLTGVLNATELWLAGVCSHLVGMVIMG